MVGEWIQESFLNFFFYINKLWPLQLYYAYISDTVFELWQKYICIYSFNNRFDFVSLCKFQVLTQISDTFKCVDDQWILFNTPTSSCRIIHSWLINSSLIFSCKEISCHPWKNKKLYSIPTNIKYMLVHHKNRILRIHKIISLGLFLEFHTRVTL